MPSARFKLVVAVMSVLTVATYVAEPILVPNASAARSPAPDFSLATIDGSTFRLSDRPNGSLVLLDFMATWCFPCRQQLQDLREIRAEVPPAALMIVSIDEEYSIDSASVARFRAAYGGINGSMEGSRWYFAADTVEEHVGLKYGVTALPTVVLIDADGAVARTWFGSVSSATLVQAIAAELRA